MQPGTAQSYTGEEPPGEAGGSRVLLPAKVPPDLLAFVLFVSSKHQIWLCLLSVLVFTVGIAPLELQRRIVNDTFAGGDIGAILHLAAAYAGVALVAGILKLTMNVYRGFVSERAVRWLRIALLDNFDRLMHEHRRAETQGVEISLVIDEADPVGASLSEPVLQGGLLIGIFAYMVYLQPLMALAAFAVFSPQLIFVPLMQKAINRRVSYRIAALRQISVGVIAASPLEMADGHSQHERVAHVFSLNMGIIRLKFSMNFLMNLMYHLGIAAILALGGYYVVKGEVRVGTIVAFVSGLGQLNEPWGDLVNWFRDLKVTETKYDMIRQAANNLRDG